MDRNRDERDTIFSRMYELRPETEKYRNYYSKHPEREEEDRTLRDHPPGVFSDREEQKLIDGLFDLIARLRPLAGHDLPGRIRNTEASNERYRTPGRSPTESDDSVYTVASRPSDQNLRSRFRVGVSIPFDPCAHSGTEPTRRFLSSHSPGNENTAENYKSAVELARSLGAILTGCTASRPERIYHTRGRGPWYGQKVEKPLPRIFIFAVPMDSEAINRAPAVEESVAVVKGYYHAAHIGLALKYWINEKGYQAICHMDGESEVILPPTAQAAGLGSIGISGLLVNEERGKLLRLAAVSTDMPLTETAPSDFDVLKVCRTCGKCAALCPSGAIPAFKDMDPEYGPRVDHEKCYKTWKELGTDCGVCLAGCPFTQKFHKSEKKTKQKENGKNEDQDPPNPLKDFMYGY